MPFVYGIVELFDGHEGAEAVKAMLNHDLQNKDSNQRPMVGFSIDGQILEKDKNGVIKSAVARDVAITTRPASKTARASLYNEEKQEVSPLDVLKHLFKNENNLGTIMDERQEKLNFLESLLKTDDISQLAKQKIKEHLDQIKNPSQQESINGRPRANLKNNGKPLTGRVPKAVPVPHRKEAYPNPFGPTSTQNIGQPRVISGDEFKQKIAAFKENAKKQNEELRNAYNDPKPKMPEQKIPSMGQQPASTPSTPPKLKVVDGGKAEPKTSWIKGVMGDLKTSEDLVLESLEKAQDDDAVREMSNGKEMLDWSRNKIKNPNMRTWYLGHVAKSPELHEQHKSEMEHHGDMIKHNPVINKIPFTKKMSFSEGMGHLRAADESWQKKQEKEVGNLVSPDPETEKKIDLGHGWGWYNLNKNQCDKESKAMGHCGTASSKNSKLWSLRKEVSKGGKVYHEPHLTFEIGEGGTLFQAKGKANKKPEAKVETPAPAVVETPVVDSVQVAVDSVKVDSTQVVK